MSTRLTRAVVHVRINAQGGGGGGGGAAYTHMTGPYILYDMHVHVFFGVKHVPIPVKKFHPSALNNVRLEFLLEILSLSRVVYLYLAC